MPKEYAAFLSYSHRYADWVETLHANLEACLAHAGETRKVFLDQVDLGTGHSWVGQLQAGLDQADHLVLVVTPEALASPRVEDEWGNFIAIDRDWKGRLQVVMLVDTPLPPFLTAIQYADFRDPGESPSMAFCRWLSAAVPWARDARLPTEEEWEYACRAGSETRYWSGDGEDDLDRVGWYDKNSEGRTHRVGEKPANPWGLYDLHGNVWEWTLSTRTDYSDREAGIAVDPSAIDPADLAALPGGGRVIRGGSCWNEARRARSGYRVWGDPETEIRNQGFRVLLPVAPRL